jgi:hypothetical protein
LYYATSPEVGANIADLKVKEGQRLKKDGMKCNISPIILTRMQFVVLLPPPRRSHRTSIPCATPQTSTQRSNEIKTVDTGALRRTNTRLNLKSKQESRRKII